MSLTPNNTNTFKNLYVFFVTDISSSAHDGWPLMKMTDKLTE